jgi:hypothetical protein
MTFHDAVEELKVLAGESHWTLVYEAASYHDDEIHAYISGIGHAKPHSTYRGAIDNMLDMINPKADPPPGEENE